MQYWCCSTYTKHVWILIWAPRSLSSLHVTAIDRLQRNNWFKDMGRDNPDQGLPVYHKGTVHQNFSAKQGSSKNMHCQFFQYFPSLDFAMAPWSVICSKNCIVTYRCLILVHFISIPESVQKKLQIQPIKISSWITHIPPSKTTKTHQLF